ncbi:MAG: dockerin type I domain-containing protein [Planctomycetota bacterium]
MTAPVDDTGSGFGQSLAIESGRLLVGHLRGDNGAGVSSGSVHVYDAGTGTRRGVLRPSDAASTQEFGYSVAIDGDTAVVGARGDNVFGNDSGSAYVFDLDTSAELSKLAPPDGRGGDYFGWSVAIGGGAVIAGAAYDDDNGGRSGSAYLFDQPTVDQPDSDLRGKLVPLDNGSSDVFGVSMAIDGRLAVIGASGRTTPFESGSAYVYDVVTGEELAELVPSDGDNNDDFGRWVALDDGRALISSHSDDDDGRDAGAAYGFDVATGQQLARLTPSDASDRDFFGWSLALDGELAVIGAVGDDDNGSGSGSAYVFNITTGRQLAKLDAWDREFPDGERDQFGWSVAIEGNVVAIGARYGNGADIGSGAVYLFDIQPRGDFNNDGVVDAADYTLWRDAQATGVFDASADANGDGAIDVMDYNVWFTTFGDAAPSSGATVPEPTAAALALSAAAALARRRRG